MHKNRIRDKQFLQYIFFLNVEHNLYLQNIMNISNFISKVNIYFLRYLLKLEQSHHVWKQTFIAKC